MTTNTGAENDVVNSDTTVEMYWRWTACMPMMDFVISNHKYRFSKESLTMAKSIDYFIKMDFEYSSYFSILVVEMLYTEK